MFKSVNNQFKSQIFKSKEASLTRLTGCANVTNNAAMQGLFMTSRCNMPVCNKLHGNILTQYTHIFASLYAVLLNILSSIVHFN